MLNTYLHLSCYSDEITTWDYRIKIDNLNMKMIIARNYTSEQIEGTKGISDI